MEMKKAFLEAFARYPDYRFIWKSRASDDVHRMLRNVQNVHVFEWIDQVSILGSWLGLFRGWLTIGLLFIFAFFGKWKINFILVPVKKRPLFPIPLFYF